MKNRIMALLITVTMIVNINELSYLTVSASNVTNQAVTEEMEDTVGLDGSDAAVTEETEGTTGLEESDAAVTEDNTSTSFETENQEGQAESVSEDLQTEADSTMPEEIMESNGNTAELELDPNTTIIYNYELLELNQEVSISVGVNQRNYLFTPTESGWYDFSVEGEGSSGIQVYAFDVNTQSKEYLGYSNNGGGIYCQLTEGNHYLFEYGKSSDFSNKIKIKKMSPITEISVTAPTKESILGYEDGLDLTGMTMTVLHEDGSSNTITNKEKPSFGEFKGNPVQVTFGGKSYTDIYETLSLGIQEAKVTYMGKEISVNINFAENKVSRIEILSNPSKMNYYKSNSQAYVISLNGLKIRAYDANDESLGEYRYGTDTTEINALILSEDNKNLGVVPANLAAGDYNIQIEFKGCTYATQDKPLHVLENTVTSIEIVKAPLKTTYYDLVDTFFDVSGLEIKVNYSDKDSEIITGDPSSIDWYMEGYQNFHLLSPSDTPYHVIISYMDQTATQDIYIKETPVESIKLVNEPSKTAYIAGGEYNLDISGMQLEVTYKDGKGTEVVSAHSKGLCGYYIQYDNNSIDWDKLGTQTATVSYMGVDATYNIEIIENTISSINISKLPDKTEFYANAGYSMYFKGLTLDVTYTTGVTEKVRAYEDNYLMISYVDFSTVGTKTVTVTYLGVKTSFEISVVENPVKSISISKAPNKATYILGADSYISTEGIELIVNYKDRSEVVNPSDTDYYVEVLDWDSCLETVGTKDVTIKYMNCTVTFQITVEENPVKSIEISKLPKKTDYIMLIDNYFDFSDLQLTVTDQQDNKKIVSFNKPSGGYPVIIDYSEVNLNMPGIQTVYVTYMGCKTSFSINIVENPVTGISVSKLPEKTKYILGYDNYLELYGLQLQVLSIEGDRTVSYGNSGEYSIATNLNEIDWSTTGVKTVKVYYMGQETSFDIEVIHNPVSSISLDTQEAKKTYYAGADDEIETYDIKMTIHYNADSGISDKTVWLEDEENYEISFNSRGNMEIPEDITPGTYPVTINYMGATSSYDVDVIAVPVASIEILEYPSCVNYYNFESDYDLSGLKFKINYNNGKEADTFTYGTSSKYLNGYFIRFSWKDEEVDENDNSYPVLGSNAIVIKYMGITNEIPVTIISTPVKNIEIISAPDKVYNKLWYSNNLWNQDIDLSGLELKITYEDSSPAHIFNITKDDKEDSRIVDDIYKRSIAAKRINNEIQLTYMNQTATYPYLEQEAEWEGAENLVLDTAVVSNIQNSSEGVIYQFTPSTSDTYRIYSYGGADSYVYVYDSNKEVINANDDGGDSLNFNLMEELEAGKTYYIVVKAYDICTFHTVIAKEGSDTVDTKTAIKNISIIDIKEPKVGEQPKLSMSIDKESTCNFQKITWTGISTKEVFQGATKYTVNVVLAAEPDFYFTSATTASINGNRVTSKKYNSDGTFTISYTFDYTDCKISIPTSENYTITGDETAAYGSDYTFSIAYADGYDSASHKIKVNGILLSPDSSGRYTIRNVKENQTITVKDITGTTAAEGEYSVSFYQDNELYDILYVKAGNKISSLQAPENVLPVIESTETDFFLGWYDNEGKRFTSNTTVDSNEVLSAKWCDRIVTSIYNGYLIYYKILSIDENNRIKVQVGTGNGLAAEQTSLPSNMGFINPLGSGVEDTLIVPSSFTGSLMGETISFDVTSIGSNAFRNCSASNIILPDTIESIGSGAFVDCTSLTGIVIPQSVQAIEEDTFSGCTSLAQVVLPSGITSIGDGAFNGCNNLDSLTIPSTIQTVSNTAFAGAGSAQGGTEFYCSPEAALVLSNSGVETNKIVSVTLTLDYEYTDLILPKQQTKELKVTGLEGDKDISEQVIWTTSDSSRIALSASQGSHITITAEQSTNQEVIVTASYKGIPAEVHVTVPVSVVDISTDNTLVLSDIESQTYTGSGITPAITVKLGADILILNTDYEIDFQNNINAGTATITITGKGNYTGSVTKTFTISTVDLSDSSIANIGSQTYTGSAITPAVNISKAGKTLKQKVDYGVTYKNNINAGTATVTITGKGNYTGTASKSFTIAAKKIELVTVGSISDMWYTGKKLEPTPAVTDGSYTLAKNKDYTVSYSNNTNAGTASMTITGKGNYNGSKEINFQIISSLDKVTGLGASSNTKSSIELTWGEVKNATGYEIYQYNTSKKKYVKIGTSAKTSYVSKKLSAATSYNYKVVAYAKVNGKTISGNASSILKTGTSTANPSSKVKISKKNATVSWKQVKGAAGYEIYMSKSKNGTYSKIGTVTKGSTVSYTKKNLQKGTYYFKVRTYVKINKVKVYSGYSSVKSVKVK